MTRTTKYFVYILLCDDDSLYTGIAKNVAARYERHVAGTGARYTRSHAPTRILYTEKLPSRSAALKREAQIKRYKREKKLKLCLAESTAA
jgi:putative endonuclease